MLAAPNLVPVFDREDPVGEAISHPCRFVGLANVIFSMVGYGGAGDGSHGTQKKADYEFIRWRDAGTANDRAGICRTFL